MSRSIKGITIKLDGETTGLQKALSDVDKRSRDVQRELRQVERLLKFNPGNTELVAQKQKLLSEQVEVTRERLNQLKAAQDEVTAAFERGEISEEQYRAFQRELVETESKLKHFESQLEQTQSKWDKFGEKAADAGEKMKRTGDKMQSVGKSMSMKITAPLTGVAAAAIKVGTDFETSMSHVAAVSGATGDDLKKLEDKAREMGSTTNKSASEAADAMGYLALAGWDTNEMLTGIEPVLKLSSAGNLDLARTAELVTNSMGAMGIEVHELNDYLDVIAKTAQSADTDIDQLGEAFITAGGKLRDLGIDFEEGAIALGLMADAGIKGSEAGRGLSAILTNLTHPTGQAKKAMEELGISVFDSNGEFIGIEEALKKVDGALEGMTQEQQNAFKSMIAGKEHAKTFSALMNGLGDEYDNLRDEVEGANGALDKMYDIMTDNLAGRWDEFKSALEETGIAIFKNLQPALETVLGFLKTLVDVFNALPGPVQGFIVVIGGLVAAIGPLLTVLGFMVSNIGALLTAVPKVIGVIKGLGGVLTAVKGAVTVFTGAIGTISAPVLAVIGVITALIAIGVALYKNWDEIKEFASEIWESIKEIFFTVVEAIGEFLLEKWDLIGEDIINVWENIKEFFSGIWELIKNIFVGAFIVILELLTGQWDEALETTKEVWENIKEALFKVWESIQEIFYTALDILDKMTGGKFSEFFDVIREYMDMIFGNIKAVWDFIKETFNNALDFVKALVTGDFEGMKNAIQNQMENAWNLIKRIWDNIKKFFSGTIGDILSNVIQKFKDIYNNIKNTMEDVFSKIKEIWDKVMDFFRDIDLTQIGKDMIQGLINGIGSMAGALVDKAKGVVDDAIQGAKNLLGIASPSKVFMSIGEDTGKGLEIGLRKMGGRVEKASEDMVAHTIIEKEVNVTGEVAGAGGGGDIIINIENMNVRNDDDINKISRELQRLIERARRGKGGGI